MVVQLLNEIAMIGGTGNDLVNGTTGFWSYNGGIPWWRIQPFRSGSFLTGDTNNTLGCTYVIVVYPHLVNQVHCCTRTPRWTTNFVRVHVRTPGCSHPMAMSQCGQPYPRLLDSCLWFHSVNVPPINAIDACLVSKVNHYGVVPPPGPANFG